MPKLWQKSWNLNQTIETFETQDDLVLDQQLVLFDVLGSLAHAQGLAKIDVLTSDELAQLELGLLEIANLDKQGLFQLQPGDEDIHTKIENYLTEHYGEVGQKIHTGRSRNDQVLTALRLFTKHQLLEIWAAGLTLTQSLLEFAQLHQNITLPGYTHMQKAMPSSVRLWASAIAEGLLDDLTSLQSAFTLINQSPLGSAAGYGVPLNLDREYTAQLLGFDKVQTNPLYCQNSRGKLEALVLASLIAISQDINKLASDVLLFSTSEFGFFEIAAGLCSGSSIMPQKKNVDLAELLRSKVHVLLGNYTQLVSLSSNLISGYHRDLQDTKKPLFESLALTHQSLVVTTLLVKGISLNHEKIKTALTPELYATHLALELVKEGTPFRLAYQQAAKEYSKISPEKYATTSTYQVGVNKDFKVSNQAFHQAHDHHQTIITTLLSGKESHANKY